MKIPKNLFWLYILSIGIYFTQGIEGLPSTAIFAYLKETLGFSVEKIMYLSSIISIPWLIKPLEGVIIDTYLTQQKFILISLFGSIVVSLYFGFSIFLTVPLLLILSTFGSFNTAFRDIANDGLACIEGKKSNTCHIFQNIQWTALTIAGIIVSLAGGLIADYLNYKIAYLCLIPIYLIIIGIVLKYKTVPKITTNKISLWKTLLTYKELFTNKPFLFTCLFIFLYNYSPGFGTKLDFIKRDIFGWSWTFMGILGAITSAISVLGAFLYYKFGDKINIKQCLFWSVFYGAANTMCYLYYTPITAIIYGVISSFIGMFIFLNIMTVMAKSTLPGKEATSFALLCCINNLSGTASTLSGAFLLPIMGLQTLIILSAVTSFACLPLIKRLEIK